MSTSSSTPSTTFELVTTPSRCAEICFYLRSCRSLIVDCEGVNLGRKGRVCLIQITSPKATYIFDLITGGPTMFTHGELGALLECRHSKPTRRASAMSSRGGGGGQQMTQQLPFPVLVMHDCRQDSDNLYAEYGVKIKNVFDTQVAHSVLRRHQSADASYPIGLNSLLQTYIGKTNTHKDMIRHEMNTNSAFWEIRPLQIQHLDYAAQDVAYLYEAFTKMLTPLKQHDLISTVMFESHQYVCQYRDHPEGASFFQRQWKERMAAKQPYTAEQHFASRTTSPIPSSPSSPVSMNRSSVSQLSVSASSDTTPISSAHTSPMSVSLSRSDSFSSQTSDIMSSITLPSALAPSLLPQTLQPQKSRIHRRSLPSSFTSRTPIQRLSPSTSTSTLIEPILNEFSYFGSSPYVQHTSQRYPVMRLHF